LRFDCSEIARLGDTVYDADGLEAGAITSGTFSAALDCPVAMAYVSLPACETGTILQVEVASANRKLSATVTDLPFVP